MHEDTKPHAFGSTLREERSEAGVGLFELAEALRMKPRILDDVERGERQITRSQFEHILERIAIVWESRQGAA